MSNPEVIDPHGIGSTLTSPSTDPAVASEPGYVDPADAAKAEATKAEADTKAQGQNKRCGNGNCGTEVPGQCCEWMSKFNVATQRAMRPYSNSCGNCNGSGGSNSNPCQACDGTGIENSTGGGFGLSALLIKVNFISSALDMEDIYTWFGYSDAIPGLYQAFYTYIPRHLIDPSNPRPQYFYDQEANQYYWEHIDQIDTDMRVKGYFQMLEFLQRFSTTFSDDWIGRFVVSMVPANFIIDLPTLNTLPKYYGKVIRLAYPNSYSVTDNELIIYKYGEYYYALQSDLKVAFPNINF